MATTYWKRGQQRHLALSLGFSKQNLNAVLHRRRGVSVKVALKLESISGVPAIEWMKNRVSKHPAFYGKPRRAL